jgi:glutathione S-transferase
MAQIISILDSYVYRTLVWDIYVKRGSRPASGDDVADEARNAVVLPRAEICLSALAEVMVPGPWLAGHSISWPIYTRLQCFWSSGSPLKPSIS